MVLSKKIIHHLENNKIPFKEFHHRPGSTCIDIATARGSDIKLGGKALLIKSKNKYYIFALPAEKKANSNKIRKILKDQKIRFATSQELQDIAGVPKGALAPLGPPFYPFDLYLDHSIMENGHIIFTAGTLTHSIMLTIDNYLKIVSPTWVDFSEKTI